MAEVFQDIIPAIMTTKKDVLIDDKDYVPFVVNRALSYHYDCVLYANVMNMYPNLDNKLQFHFLKAIIPSRKRPFQKWFKKIVYDDITLIKKYYNYSNDKATQALSILTKSQIDEIRVRMGYGKTEKIPD